MRRALSSFLCLAALGAIACGGSEPNPETPVGPTPSGTQAGPTGPGTEPGPGPGPTPPPTSGGRVEIKKKPDGSCVRYVHPECPPGGTCDPSVPEPVPCPPGM
ncbi:MAG: hypothetical protein IT376_20475 [Polyangiaceae bacterium]|nr:hypothetical protein [Polyangiaceae bacterium]